MTSAHLWAAMALLALLGWAVTLYVLTRAFLPQANSMKVLGQLNEHIDKQIRTVVERVERRQGLAPQEIGTQQRRREEEEADDLHAESLRQIESVFGGPIMEQPDPSEVVET